MKLVIFYDFSGSAPSNGMIRQNDTQMIKWLVVNGMASSVYHIIIGDIPEPVYNSIPGTHSQVIPWKTDILGSFKLWNWPMYLRMLKLVLVANYLRSVGGIEWWKEGTQTWIYPIHSNIFQSGVYIYMARQCFDLFRANIMGSEGATMADFMLCYCCSVVSVRSPNVYT